jgi:hypothetical protein
MYRPIVPVCVQLLKPAPLAKGIRMQAKPRYTVRITQTLAAAALVCLASATRADNPPVVDVEEHWELQLGAPDTDLGAPQATMVMSPTGDLNSTYFVATLNYQNFPAYQAGGLQVEQWDTNGLVNCGTGTSAGPLDRSDDVISWTQHLSLHDGQLTFQVTDGSSNSWGSFGGDALRIDTATSLGGLNNYRPAISLNESQVGYADNRVKSLVLKQLIWRTADGQTHELDAPIDIHAGLDPENP